MTALSVVCLIVGSIMYAGATFRVYFGSSKQIGWVMVVPFWFFLFDRLPREYYKSCCVAAFGAVLAVGGGVHAFITTG